MSHKPESIVIRCFFYAFITLNKRKQKALKNIQMVKMSGLLCIRLVTHLGVQSFIPDEQKHVKQEENTFFLIWKKYEKIKIENYTSWKNKDMCNILFYFFIALGNSVDDQRLLSMILSRRYPVEFLCSTADLSNNSRGRRNSSKRFNHVFPERDVEVPVYERVEHVISDVQSLHGQMNV